MAADNHRHAETPPQHILHVQLFLYLSLMDKYLNKKKSKCPKKSLFSNCRSFLFCFWSTKQSRITEH